MMPQLPFFAGYPEFFTGDSRNLRGHTPITPATQDRKHQACTPPEEIQGRRILDLGSCLAATGHWALAAGAEHYTGVELQPEMVRTSRELLTQHWPRDRWQIIEQDIEGFLTDSTDTWDVVLILGSLYAFLDTVGLLKLAQSRCRELLVIECVYPVTVAEPRSRIIEIARRQQINHHEQGMDWIGVAAKPSPGAVRVILESMGWAPTTDGPIMPPPLADPELHDVYRDLMPRPKPYIATPARWIMKFRPSAEIIAPTVQSMIQSGQGTQVPMRTAPENSGTAPWQFDSDVARRFQQEARDHIPDYQRVIDLSGDVLEQLWGQGSRDQAVCDVGSALGHTMDCLGQRGWSNVWGVESSEAMRAQSQHQDRVILSSEFPEDRTWDAVLANWTLHFVRERRAYMERVYRSLTPGGLFIVTDKMSHTLEQEALYYAFKRANGVSDEVIAAKKLRLEGILVTEPLTWYLNTLADIGFEDIQVINARWMFVSVLARRR